MSESTQDIIEWTAVLFNILYVILAAKKNILCWLFGGVASVLSVVLFREIGLYAESGLYVFYVVMAFVGWRQWNKDEMDAGIVEKNVKVHGLYIILGLVLCSVCYIIFSRISGAQFPVLDSLTTGFSILATWLTIKRVLSSWIYWIIIDLVTAYMYWSRDVNIYALLMILFTILAIFGYRSWKQMRICDPLSA